MWVAIFGSLPTRDYLIDIINNDKLVLLSINHYINGGHALLGYKYERINDKLIRIYVVDSNYTFNKTRMDLAENEIIKNNAYITFYKNDENKMELFILSAVFKISRIYIINTKYLSNH